MAYDLARLSSYVRFYQTVVNQIGAAWQNLTRLHITAKDALGPLAEPLAPVAYAPLLAALEDPEPSADAIAALWRPVDEKDLSDLNDIYEVAGRFGFQGEDNQNLSRVQRLVASARNEILGHRRRLSDLRELPNAARAAAERLRAEEEARAAAERAEKMAAFGPLAETVVIRAKQTIDAVRTVPFPDLSNAETAAEEYRKYAAKLDHVYQTCLPFLRKAIQNLYAFVNAEPTASWPDTLPITKDLPPELVTVPPAGSVELTQARASVTSLAEEEIQLGRARDAVSTAAARLEGEMAAAQMKDAEIGQEITTAHAILDLAVAAEQAEVTRVEFEGLAAQRASRVESAGAVLSRQRQIEAAIKLLEDELRRRHADLGALEAQLVETRKDEPVLFGKDEWRAKVAAMEEQKAQQQATYGQRLATLQQFQIDHSSVSVEVQTEQQKQALLERQIVEAQSKAATLELTIREIGTKLGAARPSRAVSADDARKALGSLQQAKLGVAERMEALKAEMRRQKDEAVRVLNRMKQIGVERQHVTAMVQSAETAATQGREEALRQLARERRAGVERHVGEVLATLEKSIAHVGPVFVDPARDLLVAATEPKTEVTTRVLEAAEAAVPVVDRLYKELDPDLLAQDATLGQIQREFCDVAEAACVTAWGG
ncbi:hypothetical protein [Polyangium sorediatum]|uniref:Uncharacterized protein n=1 Tax=Polyangium sorediatum TaxID=889274 RepID=A0ABT6P492_9BACT|nr:hypothetical protein [Polyangium sorediatum]MDI1435354.1 hypothetical protein [Polyangium sorediatum]